MKMSSPPNPDPPVCTFCQSPTATLHSCCCGQVSYCGKDCQRADWKRHKPDCPPFITKEVSGKGRGLVATRNLPLGFTLLTEDAVLVISTNNFNYDKLLADFLSKNKETRMEILKLYDGTEGTNEDLTDTKKLVAKLDRIVEINSILRCMVGQENTKNVYLKASLLNHDCRPNLTWHSLFEKKERILVNVLRKVEKGDELTVSYIKDENCPTRIQRKESLVKYRFDCQCDICKKENPDDEKMRKEFQQLTHDQIKMNDGSKLFTIAKRKLELSRMVDDHAVFSPLIECWKLSERVAACSGSEDLKVKVAQYKKEAKMLAQILGPSHVMAFWQLELERC